MSATQEVGEIFATGAGAANATLRSSTILICLIALWGMNMSCFRLFGIDYVKVLYHDLEQRDTPSHPSDPEEDEDDTNDVKSTSSLAPTSPHNNSSSNKCSPHPDDEELTFVEGSVSFGSEEVISGSQLMFFAGTLMLNLHLTHYFWTEYLGGTNVEASVAFYGGVLTALLVPSTKWLRQAVRIVAFRIWKLANCTTRPVPFIDVFFADSMCSLSKVFFDWGMLVHLAHHYPNPVPQSARNIILPSFAAALPYLIRARQCWAMWTLTSESKHIWNGVKYASSILPLILSACQKVVASSRLGWQLEHVLVVVLIVNASYALWWDIGMCCDSNFRMNGTTLTS